MARIPWNKGGGIYSEETLKKMSDSAKKRWSNPENRKAWSEIHKGQKPWNTGKKRPEMTGENNHKWKGGISTINNGIRASSDYFIWRRNVLARDDYTCQECHNRGVYLHVDHIKSFADYPELRFDLNNGRTLCMACHYLKTYNRVMPKYVTNYGVNKKVRIGKLLPGTKLNL